MRSKRFIVSAIGLALSIPAGVVLAAQSGGMQQQSAPSGAQSSGGMQQGAPYGSQQPGAMQRQSPSPGAQSQQTLQQFRKADSDGNGYLSLSEATSAALPEMDQQKFQIADTDRDGRLNQHEFQTAMKSSEQVQSQAQQQTGGAETDVIWPEQQRQQQQQQAAARTGTGGLWAMKAGELEGKEVVNAQGEEIGEVGRIVRGMDNQAYAIVSVGGFMGMGEKEVAIPLNDLDLQGEQLALSSGTTEEQLEQRAESQQEQEFQALGEDDRLADYAGSPKGAATASFQELDQDRDGFVTSQEATQNQSLANQWHEVDSNSDGKLDQAEFSAFEAQQQ